MKLYSEEIYRHLFAIKEAEKYISKFRRIKERGIFFPDWNWSCFAFSGFWLLYRKLGLLWLVYMFVIAAASVLLMRSYGAFGFYVFYGVFAKLLLPMYANQLVFLKANRYIGKIYNKNGDPLSDEHRNALSSIVHPSKDNPSIL